MRTYAFFSTQRCTNDCRICCVKGKDPLKFYHVGRKEEDKIGLDNLLEAISSDGIAITGGDPLRNPYFTDNVLDKSFRSSSIMINPLSFLCIESGLNASRIDEETAKDLVKEGRKLSNTSKKAISQLKGFGTVGVSTGKSQAPNLWIMDYAKKFFGTHVEPLLKDSIQYSSFKRGEDFAENEGKFSIPNDITCAGRLREWMSVNRDKIPQNIDAEGIGLKRSACYDSSLFDMRFAYFRKTSDDVHMYFNPCWSPGVNEYVSYKSDITLAKLAESNPSDVRNMLDKEHGKYTKSSLFRLMNEMWNGGYDSCFELYRTSAQNIIQENQGKSVKVMDYVMTTRGEEMAHYCEACNAIGVMLKEHKITPGEWQAYLDDNVGHPNGDGGVE